LLDRRLAGRIVVLEASAATLTLVALWRPFRGCGQPGRSR
jgi:hypothetical protein